MGKVELPYLRFECIPAVRRTARADSLPQRSARNSPCSLSAPAGSGPLLLHPTKVQHQPVGFVLGRALLKQSAAWGGGELRDSKSRKAQPNPRPKALPRVCLTAALLSLRRVCRRPLGFHLDFAVAKRVKSLFRRAGDGFLCGIEFFARLARFNYIRLSPK